MAIPTTFVHRPQRVRARRMLFQIHLWAGILLSLYLAIIGISGSLLVFEDEFTAFALPKTRAQAAATGRLRLEDLLEASERATPGARAYFVSFPQNGRPFYRVWLKDGAGRQTVLAADAATGALLPGPRPWIEWVHDLHIYLLLGPSGLIVNGVGAGALLLLALTGLVLWWPGVAHWTRALWVRRRSGWRRINFDLHSAIGFWTLGLVLWWAISGVYFAWPVQFARAVNAVSRIEGMRPPAIPRETSGAGGHADLDTMIDAARRATPGGSVSGIALPPPTGGNVIVYVDRRTPGDFSHRDIHYFGAASGRLLATWHYGENRTAGDWFLWAMHPLHFGTLWGLGPKILWALAGLSLPALSVTGLLMYWNRKLRFAVRGFTKSKDQRQMRSHAL